MNILVLGAGGVGGYFGGQLAASGADVTFLVRERRAAQLAADGLVIETPKERLVVRPNWVTAENVRADYDVVLLSCKAWDLNASIAAITPAMRDDTMVVPLLNGMAHLDVLDAAFGRARVMGGSCQIAATLTREGIVRSLSEFQNILWGVRDANPRQQIVASGLAEAYGRTSVGWSVSPNVLQDMWEKLAFLCTLAGMTTLMRASVGEILATADGQAIMRRFADTCIAIATAEGFTPRDAVRQRFDSVLQSTGSTMTASMLRDIESGNPVEADHIVGFMLSKARQHKLDDALLTFAYTHLKAYEARRAAQRLPGAG
jgi:2-dehydropantoate 2-reductase